jgi:hypothetical protein
MKIKAGEQADNVSYALEVLCAPRVDHEVRYRRQVHRLAGRLTRGMKL